MTRQAFLDRPAARILAVLCFLMAVAALGYIHRDDLLPGTQDAATDPLSVCIAARSVEIDTMVREGLITAAQSDVFKQRVEGVCRAQTGVEDPGPPPPSLPR